ncbi:MAG: hypothetical protein ACK4UU_04055, partial [Fimbriimonadales bacterium]
ALRLALQWIRENPVEWLGLLGRKLALTLSAFGLQHPEHRAVAAALRFADIVYWLFLIAAGYGFWRLRGVDRQVAALVGLLLGWTLLTILLYAGGSRPLLPAQPFLVLGVAIGVERVGTRPRSDLSAP